MFLSRLNVLCVLTAVLLAPGPGSRPVAAADLVLHIPGITGSSTTPLHTNDIAVRDLSLSVLNPSGTNVVYGDVYLTKTLDKTSPLLASNIVNGVRFQSMTIYETRTNNTPTDLMTLTLNGVYITSQQTSGSVSGGKATEALSLHFNSMTWAYAQ